MEETIRRFKEHLAKQHAYEHALGVLYYDAETVMPRAGGEGLSRTIGVLSEESYRLSTAPELKELLQTLLENKAEIDWVTQREAEELSEKYPDRKIIVIDSLCASLGEGLLVHKAVTLKEQGHTLEETADWIEANKLHLVHNFTVNDLFHLYRGGRVSKTAAFLGTMISLKPLLHVDDEGHLIPLSKVRGRKKSLIALVDAMEKQIGSWRDKNDTIFISHGDCIEDAQYVADLIKDRFGYESFLINHVGPTIGAHTGPGVVALFYMGDYR